LNTIVLVTKNGAASPMFVADALGNPAKDRMRVDSIDNTDPDGIARTLQLLAGRLGETLCVVTSKSGGTPETRNGMLLLPRHERPAWVPRHAVLHDAWLATGPDRRGRLARSLPDVRLDRWPNQ
jgi:glucose-6-phosphate isomerase